MIDAKDVLIKSCDEIIQQKCINLQYLTTRTKANPALMMEMITLYLEQTPPLIEAMNHSLNNNDWVALHAAVHKIIPSFSIMGISVVYENIAKEIQLYANAELQDDGIHRKVLQLQTILKQSIRELKDEFTILKNTPYERQ